MKIAFDIDGVIANYVRGFMALIIALSGRDLFLESDWTDPPCWDWYKLRGYTKDEVSAAQTAILESPDFWFNLEPMTHDVAQLAIAFEELDDHHEVYFITHRSGQHARRQTEDWLVHALGLWEVPTVLLVGYRMKGVAAKALGLDLYIDDNYDNCLDCVEQSPLTRTYLLDRAYNRVFEEIMEKKRLFQSSVPSEFLRTVEDRRVPDIGGMLGRERLTGYTEGVATPP